MTDEFQGGDWEKMPFGEFGPRNDDDGPDYELTKLSPNKWRFEIDDHIYEIESKFGRDSLKAQVTVMEGKSAVYSSSVNLESEGSRRYYAENAIIVDISKDDLQRHLLQMYLALKDIKEREENPTPETLSDEMRRLGENFLRRPDLIEQIDRDLEALGIVGETKLRQTTYLTATSRKLKKPLAVSIVGSSASGKSYILEEVASLLPTNEVNVATARTQESLFYLRKTSLRNVWVITKEYNPEDEGSLAMRELLSAGKLSKDLPVRDPKTGEFTTKKIEVEGPISYSDTTTRIFRYEEDLTRLLQVFTDETKDQTRKIHDAQRDAVTVQGLRRQHKADEIRKRHIAAQCLLKAEGDGFEIVIPFAHAIEFPTDRVEYRRRFPHFLTAIKTVALLRQFQREIKEDSNTEMRILEATLGDYETARSIFGAFIEQAFRGLDRKSEEALDVLRESATGTFSANDVQKWLKVGRSQTRERVKALVAAGALEVVEESRGSRPAVYRVSEDFSLTEEYLPTVDEVRAKFQDSGRQPEGDEDA